MPISSLDIVEITEVKQKFSLNSPKVNLNLPQTLRVIWEKVLLPQNWATPCKLSVQKIAMVEKGGEPAEVLPGKAADGYPTNNILVLVKAKMGYSEGITRV